MNGESGFFLVSGGRGDGKRVRRDVLPRLSDRSEVHLAVGGDHRHLTEVYRRDGGLLVYVREYRCVYFVGGPSDGSREPEDAVGEVKDGEHGLMPFGKSGREQYAWYQRHGRDMVFTGDISNPEDLARVDQESVHRLQPQ
jgi:hypothetical protein